MSTLLILEDLQVRRVRCEASGVMVPKDKAIKRFIVRNIVDASAIRDIQDASVIDCKSSPHELTASIFKLPFMASTTHI